jgi:hypothetical protein
MHHEVKQFCACNLRLRLSKNAAGPRLLAPKHSTGLGIPSWRHLAACMRFTRCVDLLLGRHASLMSQRRRHRSPWYICAAALTHRDKCAPPYGSGQYSSTGWAMVCGPGEGRSCWWLCLSYSALGRPRHLHSKAGSSQPVSHCVIWLPAKIVRAPTRVPNLQTRQ